MMRAAASNHMTIHGIGKKPGDQKTTAAMNSLNGANTLLMALSMVAKKPVGSTSA